jgi:hypothetical protein
MQRFIIREKQREILISLPLLVQRLSFLPVAFWAFREITVCYPQPFGLSVVEFERLSRELTLGFVVSNQDFQNFLKAEFQIIDGCIDAYVFQPLPDPLFNLECVDSSQWEISTSSPIIAEQLKIRGFKD